MKQKWVIQLLGTVSVLCLIACVLTSAITFMPQAQESVRQFMLATYITSAVAALATLGISVASDARGLRRLGLWFSLPTLMLILLLSVASMTSV